MRRRRRWPTRLPWVGFSSLSSQSSIRTPPRLAFRRRGCVRLDTRSLTGKSAVVRTSRGKQARKAQTPSGPRDTRGPVLAAQRPQPALRRRVGPLSAGAKKGALEGLTPFKRGHDPDQRPQPTTHRSVLLADCDVYYVQLARLADPQGAGCAPHLIVGGTAQSRGVVCSASYEVREFGVRSGMPIARALRLCPHAMCVPVPRRLCAEKSREVVRVLKRFAPAVQSASPDEAYLELTSAMDTVYRGRTLEAVAHDIRRAVLAETAIRISLGGGTNRLVAKLAVERAKPRPGTDGRGVHVVKPGQEADFVATVTLGDIPGIGPKFQQRLGRIGWRRCGQRVTARPGDTGTGCGPTSGALAL